MSWVLMSLASAAVTALVSISDKTVIYRYARSPLTLPLLIGIAQTAVGVVALTVAGIPPGNTVVATASGLFSGALFGLSGVLSQRVLFTQEVSRTIPIIQTAPIFAALLAFAVLNEAISHLQWVGIILMVVGSATLSLQLRSGERGVFLHNSFYLLMLSAFLLGSANVIGKLALEELPVIYTHGLRMFALGLVFLGFASRTEPWADVRGYLKYRSPALLFVTANEFITANVGLLLLLWALAEGPASLVTALTGTRAFFVVLYSTTLAVVWRGALGEEISLGIIITKVLAVLLIVIGVAAIAFE